MTNEGKSDTDKWAETKKPTYAYAYDKGGKLASFFGVSGIPHAALIDATGTILWSGHPAELSEGLIEKATEGALSKPFWEWTGAAKDVKAAMLKHSYKAALDGAAKLTAADDGPAIAKAIEGLVASRVAGMKADYEKGNFLGAEDAATALQKELEGLPGKDDAVKLLADLKANKQAPPVLKAQKQIAKMRDADIHKSKEIDAAIEDLKKIAKDLSGTYAATQADDLMAELRKLKSKK